LKQFKDTLESLFEHAEQHTPAFFIDIHFNKKMCSTVEQIDTIKHVLSTHDQDAWLWLELGILYMDLFTKKSEDDAQIFSQLSIHSNGSNSHKLRAKKMAIDCFSEVKKLVSLHKSSSHSFYSDLYDKILNISIQYLKVINGAS